MKRIYTPTRAKRILIVDDDDLLASIYQDTLRGERFEVEIASDREIALQRIEDGSVCLVILDLSLLKIDGVEILKSIRSHRGTATLPVIIFSNTYLSHASDDRLKIGATRCVNRSDCTLRSMIKLVREMLPGSASDKNWSEQSPLEHEKKVTRDFVSRTGPRLAHLRDAHCAFASIENEDARRNTLFEMHQQTRFLLGAAAIAGFQSIAQFVAALEALISELYAKAERITDSTTRTIAHAIDLLGLLLEQAPEFEAKESVSPAILVVDDEIISRQAVCSALERAGLAPVCEGDPMMAEKLLEQTHFNLIFLDVNMPGKSGWDLCATVRKMATNCATPVVFVTVRADLACRAQSSLSGGKDFIAKPFLAVELALKALTWLCKEKAQSLSIAASHEVDVNEKQTTETGLEQHNHESKTERPHVAISSRN